MATLDLGPREMGHAERAFAREACELATRGNGLEPACVVPVAHDDDFLYALLTGWLWEADHATLVAELGRMGRGAARDPSAQADITAWEVIYEVDDPDTARIPVAPGNAHDAFWRLWRRARKLEDEEQ